MKMIFTINVHFYYDTKFKIEAENYDEALKKLHEEIQNYPVEIKDDLSYKTGDYYFETEE